MKQLSGFVLYRKVICGILVFILSVFPSVQTYAEFGNNPMGIQFLNSRQEAGLFSKDILTGLNDVYVLSPNDSELPYHGIRLVWASSLESHLKGILYITFLDKSLKRALYSGKIDADLTKNSLLELSPRLQVVSKKAMQEMTSKADVTWLERAFRKSIQSLSNIILPEANANRILGLASLAYGLNSLSTAFSSIASSLNGDGGDSSAGVSYFIMGAGLILTGTCLLFGSPRLENAVHQQQNAVQAWKQSQSGNEDFRDLEKGEDPNHSECAICIHAVEENNRESTPCGHHFHPICLETWKTFKKVCPMCRANLN